MTVISCPAWHQAGEISPPTSCGIAQVRWGGRGMATLLRWLKSFLIHCRLPELRFHSANVRPLCTKLSIPTGTIVHHDSPFTLHSSEIDSSGCDAIGRPGGGPSPAFA